MSQTLEMEAVVLAGGRIEVRVPEAAAGRLAQVRVTLKEESAKRPFREVLGDYRGGQLFRTGEEVDAFLNAERSAWD